VTTEIDMKIERGEIKEIIEIVTIKEIEEIIVLAEQIFGSIGPKK
jgi:hypothetical protein